MNDLIEDVLVARTPDDMRQALDDLYATFSDQIDDEKIVENIDDDHERFTQLTIALLRLGAACKNAKSLLVDANAGIAIPLVRDMIMACVATSSFTASLSPAALELGKARRRREAQLAIARAANPKSRNSPIVDKVVEDIRQRWIESGKAIPTSYNRFSQKIVDEVNEVLAASGGDPVKESAIAKRLKRLAEQDVIRGGLGVHLVTSDGSKTTSLTNDEDLFG